VGRWSSHLPERRLALRILARGASLWVLARGAILAVEFSGRMEPPETLFPALTPSAALMLVLTVGALGALESRRLNEHRFFANLGISPTVVALLVMLPAICGETLSGIIRHP
jgi:hypothetical protein